MQETKGRGVQDVRWSIDRLSIDRWVILLCNFCVGETGYGWKQEARGTQCEVSFMCSIQSIHDPNTISHTSFQTSQSSNQTQTVHQKPCSAPQERHTNTSELPKHPSHVLVSLSWREANPTPQSRSQMKPTKKQSRLPCGSVQTRMIYLHLWKVSCWCNGCYMMHQYCT